MIIFMSPLPKVKSRRVVANMSMDLTGGKLHRPPFRPWHRNFKRFAILPPFCPYCSMSMLLQKTSSYLLQILVILSSSQNHSMTSRLNQVLRIPSAPLASRHRVTASPAARKILGALIADSLAAARAKSIQDIHQHGGQKWSQGNIFENDSQFINRSQSFQWHISFSRWLYWMRTYTEEQADWCCMATKKHDRISVHRILLDQQLADGPTRKNWARLQQRPSRHHLAKAT